MSDTTPVPILGVPPAGHEPATSDPGDRPVSRCALVDVVRGVGVDPSCPASVVDLASVGAVSLLWRCSPQVERWHHRILQSEMMRANAAATRLARGSLCTYTGLSRGPGDDRGRAGVAARMFAEIGRTVADPDRRLPDGRTLAEWAGDRRELAGFQQHVQVRVRWWMILAFRLGPSAVLLLLALCGGAQCRRWWLMPWWPERVAQFVRRCRHPTRWADPAMTAAVQALCLPPDIPDFDVLRDQLLAGPDTLSAAGAGYCMRAGIHHVSYPLMRPGTLQARYYAVLLLDPGTSAALRRRARDALFDRFSARSGPR